MSCELYGYAHSSRPQRPRGAPSRECNRRRWGEKAEVPALARLWPVALLPAVRRNNDSQKDWPIGICSFAGPKTRSRIQSPVPPPSLSVRVCPKSGASSDRHVQIGFLTALPSSDLRWAMTASRAGTAGPKRGAAPEKVLCRAVASPQRPLACCRTGARPSVPLSPQRRGPAASQIAWCSLGRRRQGLARRRGRRGGGRLRACGLTGEPAILGPPPTGAQLKMQLMPPLGRLEHRARPRHNGPSANLLDWSS